MDGIPIPQPAAAGQGPTLADMAAAAVAGGEEGRLGTAIYLLASLFNHSCTPNVDVTFPFNNSRLCMPSPHMHIVLYADPQSRRTPTLHSAMQQLTCRLSLVSCDAHNWKLVWIMVHGRLLDDMLVVSLAICTWMPTAVGVTSCLKCLCSCCNSDAYMSISWLYGLCSYSYACRYCSVCSST